MATLAALVGRGPGGLRIRQRLADQATEWIEQDRDESLLYRGAQLRLAVELQEYGQLDLTGPEREFLDRQP